MKGDENNRRHFLDVYTMRREVQLIGATSEKEMLTEDRNVT